MILDQVDQLSRYVVLHPRLARVLDFVRSRPLAELSDGRHPVAGDEVYAMVSHGDLKPRADAQLEAHRRYIDVQFVLDGNEEMGWRDRAGCRNVTSPYHAARDIEFMSDEPLAWIRVPREGFVIFFPEDAHAPMVGCGRSHKLIIKVAV
jgi:YhcH/YjgK/YiaL family protein